MNARARTNPQADADVQQALRQLEVEALNFAYRFVKDNHIRQQYLSRTKAFSEEVLNAYRKGELSAKQAAEAAHQMRNEIMEWARARSSDLGRAKAKSLKAQGLDFDDLAEKYSQKKFRKAFSALSEAEKSDVFLEMVESAGRANPKVSARAARLGAVGRGLWVLSAVIAVYNVGRAEYKIHAAGREAASVGGGFAGGAAGGALAGIWFGPVGVAVGVVIGGVLGCITADQAYIELTGPREAAVRRLLPRFTHMFHVDEGALARALISELGIDMESVLVVLRELERSYSTDVDDVAVLYVGAVRAEGQTSIEQGLKLNRELRELLIDAMESGWTSDDEKRSIGYLKALATPG